MAKDSIAVLIIDGNDKTRSFSVDRLNASSAKYRIYEASSGTAGLKLCKKYSFDCVVVSLALPDISGLQVLVNLVPVTSKPTVPVIVLTETSALLEDIVKKGAYCGLEKNRLSGDSLHNAILQGIAATSREQRGDNEEHNTQ